MSAPAADTPAEAWLSVPGRDLKGSFHPGPLPWPRGWLVYLRDGGATVAHGVAPTLGEALAKALAMATEGTP